MNSGSRSQHCCARRAALNNSAGDPTGLSGIPKVRVVVVNYNSGVEILSCLQSIFASDLPNDSLDVVVVDNGSTDGSLELLERELPKVRLVRSPSNLGYSAFNQVIADLEGVDYVALINPDAAIDSGCLPALIDALGADRDLGAACPRILLKGAFREIQLEISGHRRNYLDLLGVEGPANWHLSGPRVRRRWNRDVAWSVGDGTVLRVDSTEGEIVRLRVRANRPTRLKLQSGENAVETLLDRAPGEVSIAAAGASARIIQNAGSIIGKHGLGINRGFHRVDGPPFDMAGDVPAWCGAAVLMRSRYLRDVGGFDPKFFLYYEDLDLSWRGLVRGWRYRYVPEAVVFHAHSMTIGHGSRVYEFHHERNRLLTVTKNAPWREVMSTWAGAFKLIVRQVLGDVAGRILDRRKPEFVRTGRRLGALVSAMRLAPVILLGRRKSLGNPFGDQNTLQILGRWREPPGGASD